MSRFSPDLVDAIYEAALVPERWPNVLGRISRSLDGVGGLLFTSRLDRMQWTSSPDIYENFVEFVRDGWAARNQRMPRMATLPDSSHAFVRDADCMTAAEMDADSVYSEFFRKRGLGWATGTLLDVPSGDSIVFSFERAYRDGPTPREFLPALNDLRPHLARAALMASRLGLERARSMAATMEMLGLPGAVLTETGRLAAANPLFEALVPKSVQDRRDRIHLVHQPADDLLAVAIGSLSVLRDAGGTTRSVPVPATEDQPPLILHLVPVRAAALDIFTASSALLVVTPVDRVMMPDAQLLRGLFDLTAAEARVASGIVAGKTLEQLAGDNGLSRETVRSQLRGVFAKTGMRRQSELIRLLAGWTPGTDR